MQCTAGLRNDLSGVEYAVDNASASTISACAVTYTKS